MSRLHITLAMILLAAPATVVWAQSPSAPAPENRMNTAALLNAQLAIAYLKQGDVGLAQKKIDKALGQNAHESLVQLGAGLVYERLEQTDKAGRFYETALRLDPHNPDMQNTYGGFQCRHGHAAEGQKLFEQAAKNPAFQTPEVAYTNAGVCARDAKDLPRAEAFFRQALLMKADFPDALLQLADVTFTRGQGLQARALVERYLRASPATPETLLLAWRIERSLGDVAMAAKYEAQLRHDFPESNSARELINGASTP
jgi:type IV pilus assembly protein PilF